MTGSQHQHSTEQCTAPHGPSAASAGAAIDSTVLHLCNSQAIRGVWVRWEIAVALACVFSGHAIGTLLHGMHECTGSVLHRTTEATLAGLQPHMLTQPAQWIAKQVLPCAVH
jgi:hypothetical protein